MNKSDTIAELAKALAAAQAELKNPPLDETADTGKYSYRYVSLATVRDAVTAVFARHGLSVLQSAGNGDRGPRVTTLLMHVSGEWVEADPLEMPVAKQDAQGYGSAITYARRYSLQAVANVVGDGDDDAQQAVQPAKPAAKARAAAPAPKPFYSGLVEYDARLAQQGLCSVGDLVKAVAAAGKKLGHPADLTTWDAEQIKVARAETEHFEQARRAAQKPAKAS